MGFSLPRSRLAALTATRPSTWSAASITHHWCFTSDSFAENVLICSVLKRGAKSRYGGRHCQQVFRKSGSVRRAQFRGPDGGGEARIYASPPYCSRSRPGANKNGESQKL